MSRFIISLFAVTAIITQVYSQTVWTKDTLNPVLPKGSSGEWDSNIIENPYVLFDGAVYHMWYAGSDGTGLRIGYAHSSDGINWTKYDDPTTTTPPYAESDPVLSAGPEAWDSQWVDAPNVLFINGVYHMWHSGSNGTIIQTGHATSLDGLTWAKDTLNPVLPVGTSGSWDDTWASLPSVLFDGSIYRMWYSGSNGTGFDWSIGYATSSDGRHWDKDTTHNPVLEPGLSGSWDDTYVGQSSVIFNNDSTKFRMWYGGGTGFAIGEIGYATAPIITGIKALNKNLSYNYVLHQNYPNPFNPTTNIEFSIPNSEFVTLKVFNILGEEVATLVSERLAAGNYNYDWDASGLASGVYLYRIQTENYVEAKKMVLMK
jgi:predicted GH43/DUF377 family glycosyl hydrolase